MNCYFSKVTRKMNNRPMAWDRSGRQYFMCPPEVRSTLDKDVFFQPREIKDDFENVITWLELQEYIREQEMEVYIEYIPAYGATHFWDNHY